MPRLAERRRNGDDRNMTEKSARSRYAQSLAELERSAHVPLDEQVSEQAEPPPRSPLAPEELDRQRLLGITGAGRLRQP